ncbi:translation elongation factor 4 [Tichowtungia aerotolerans]|uniref:Elongation factor 4 n=1 Tax=Tichowtungia aerotolerans TaxID=2697043 RepID=A0A6P1MCZ1_9BACT|nr:translation elongation factor 4 [Tichowtungia aerotolerans]QHI70444.1 elongation factor 4 [Tichowtungia aerotolerans]
MSDLSHIRNFCIIAHIDHGKSTLADRILQLTGAVEERKMKEQLLDDMDLERERGITIKAHPVSMNYKAKDGKTYQFNLIDTPGHVDFSYEVSRSLQACEGAILVVDAAQGVEAQTVSNTYLAEEQNLAIFPVLNKIELPNAQPEVVAQQIEDLLAIEASDCLTVSAKTGQGIAEVLEAVVARIPPPKPGVDSSARGLVFDSKYDAFRGVVVYLRLFSGSLKPGEKVRMMGSEMDYEIKEVGIFAPDPTPVKELKEGSVGYVIANIKDASEIQIGDTMTSARHPAATPLPGFKEIHPMVFAGIYPIETSDYEKLGKSLDKLKLNDAAFTYQAESSVALGFGFRCGFLGLLHMEIVQERLRREFDLDIIASYPNVIYRVNLKSGETLEVDNPTMLPDVMQVQSMEEPFIKATIITPTDCLGDMMQLIMEKRGEITHTDSIDAQRVMLTCDLPLNEVLIDFYDRLKSISRGYASMDYEYADYRESDLVKMDILIHSEPVDAFSAIVHRSKAVYRGRQMCASLKDVIPRQAFSVAIQAALGGKIIARETIRAYRKDVTAKCYGGDISRKRKLLERQKEGKKKMKSIGKVNIPQEAFIAVLKTKQE